MKKKKPNGKWKEGKRKEDEEEQELNVENVKSKQ